jgi:hypothetical protein
MKAVYISVWDDCDEVRTSCDYDPQTKLVSNIEKGKEPDGANCCTEEFIELPDGTKIDRENFQIEE